MKYLLDTNVCVTWLRGKNALLKARLTAHAPTDLVVCSLVVGELCVGAAKSNKPAAEQQRVDAFLALYQSLPFGDSEARKYAEVRAYLESRGTPIGDFDLAIAATALVHDLTLVTHNTSEFSRVPGLALEDWEIP
jgi:tRNA(fMet)-specific endonuclease VapC